MGAHENFGRHYPPLVVDVDFSLAKWNTVAVHRIFTVTGFVVARVSARATTALTGTSATIQLGLIGATTNMIAATTITDFVAGELWYDATPTTKYDTVANAFLERAINGINIAFEIATAAATGGTMRFVCEWYSPDNQGTVSEGNGEAT